jgi:bla regulator protein blaR1
MIQAICWVLIHSVWQGLLLALAGGGVILGTRRAAAAAVRYRLLCGLFGLFLAGVGATFFYEWAAVSDASGDVGGDGGGVGISMGWMREFCNVHGLQIVVLWLVFAVLKSMRMAVGFTYMMRIRREGLPVAGVWVKRVEALSRRLGIRRTVRLLESGLVKVPLVIGQLRPIILVPLGMINHLPAGEMEAVLLHELAHIRRLDHVVNMIQQAVECLFFFNPGLLWISALLRAERENCCDDVAIAETGNRVEFVRALVRFKEHSMKGLGLAFPGDRRQLLYRVLRISRQENKTLTRWERSFLLAGSLILLWLGLAKADRAAVVRREEAAQVSVAGHVAAVRPMSPELVKVIQTRQQVAQNMEWVEAQLAQIHHREVAKSRGRKAAVKDRGVVVGDQVARNGDQMVRNADQVVKNREQDMRNLEQDQRNAVKGEEGRQTGVKGQQGELERNQAELERRQAELDREQAERDRQQADRDRLQADRDKAQAGKDQEQAARDQEQAMRDREQAARDREQAVRDRESAGRERQQEQDQRVRDSEQASREREQAEKDRQQASRDREKAELDRQHVEHERQMVELQRLKAIQEKLKADQERIAVAAKQG